MRTFVRMGLATAAIAIILLSTPVVMATPPESKYPNKTVRLVVPFAPGGVTDIIARIIAKRLSERSGQPFIVDNRAGAGGNIGMEAVAQAEPNGYTLGMIITSHAINMTMPPKPNYDVLKDLEPLNILLLSNNVLVVNPKIPATTVKELVDYITSKPSTFASAGNGTTPHLSGELFKQMSGTKMIHVPYRGAGLAMTDVIAGNVTIMFDAIATAAPHIQSGAVRALAVTGAHRSPQLPDVPTMDEAGYKGYVIEGWLGMVGPKGLPKVAADWVMAHVAELMKEPEIQQRLRDQGMTVTDISGDKAKTFIAGEVDKWQSIVSKIGEAQ